MKTATVGILLLNIVCVYAQFPHDIIYFVGCFVNGSAEVEFQFDGEEMLYVDFQTEDIVYTVPSFIDPDPSQVLLGLSIIKDAIKNKRLCLALTAMAEGVEEHKAEEKDPPDSMLFPAREIEPGEENSLICFVNNFYPPSIKVTWTKNNHPVSEDISISQYFPNNDQTFRQFSTLTFTPSEGDIYSCTVEHMALEAPKTRFWEVESLETNQSLGPLIYCGVGVFLGLLGIGIGVFFIVKAQNGY